MHQIQDGGLDRAAARPRTDAPGHTRPAPIGDRLRHGVSLARDGHVGEALAVVEALLTHPDPDVEDLVLALATAQDCRLARGDVGDALALAERLAPYLSQPGRTGALAQHAAGELAAALNEVEVAAGHFAAAGALLVDSPDREADAQLVPWRVGAALSAVRLGRRGEGATLARQQHELAAGTASGAALALRTLAATEAGGGRTALLRRAAVVLAPLRYGRLAAQVDTDLAGLLLLGGTHGGERAEAVELLRRAEEHAGRHQLWPLQTRVRGLLDRAGEPARRSPHEVLATLTVPQRRVTALAAEGLTNRQIADELGVSVKAVEAHLSLVYRKLGIRSRAGLGPALGA